MQGNFFGVNCYFIIEVGHNDESEEHEHDPAEVDNLLEIVISEITGALRKKYRLVNISKEDIEQDGANCMGCSTKVICEFVCTESKGGKHRRKYTIQVVLRSGYYCCFNLDFNVIKYDDSNNVLSVNREIRFRSKRILNEMNLAIEDVRRIFATHAKEAYVAGVYSNGEVIYSYY